ncbi:ABC transporter permease [Celeribacter indicus]|uniref:ABC transporter permease n=1 Tax=Celeribacter indicus TaxID=1208324 RepID=A0A0B5DRW3_9RHOB|nr:ABC transporter permease subunit [Celeribacter indicus]AJE45784.1 ABC transporter permease [Celeribacter indicus]SDW60559.1 putative spermidine/putrescine transport system permease protein [Celeribacter indicus]
MADQAHAAPLPQAARAPRRVNLSWLGVAPFILFTALFLIFPIFYLINGAFRTAEGAFTLENLIALTGPEIWPSYWLSIRLSFASALLGGIFGTLLAWAVHLGGLPGWVKRAFLTFSGVASNFAGVPLAFAFIATLGRLGLVTLILRDVFGINIYGQGFTLFSFWGLAITYLYFQLPLMMLLMMPAMEGLRPEWREAAASLGASGGQFWRMVALPVLAPSALGCFLLLFANAFGTLATVYALTSANFPVVPIVLFQQIRGNVLYNPNLGYALALGMVLIMALSNTLYFLLRNRAERWRK